MKVMKSFQAIPEYWSLNMTQDLCPPKVLGKGPDPSMCIHSPG
jgi:hypothetical protein